MVVEVVEWTLAATLHRLAGRALAKACSVIRYKLGAGLLPTVDDIEVSKCFCLRV